jgi:hypothetical protein
VEELLEMLDCSDDSHTGVYLEKATKEVCAEYGIGEYVLEDEKIMKDTVCDFVHKTISDNAANAKLGYLDFQGAECCAHTGQLSVLKFLDHPGKCEFAVCDMFVRIVSIRKNRSNKTMIHVAGRSQRSLVIYLAYSRDFRSLSGTRYAFMIWLIDATFGHTLCTCYAEVAGLLKKVRGVVTHFNSSTVARSLLREAQEQAALPESKPIRDIPTRWNSTHASMEWFVINKYVVNLKTM